MSLPVIREPLANSPVLPPLRRPASSIFDIPIDLGPPVELLATPQQRLPPVSREPGGARP